MTNQDHPEAFAQRVYDSLAAHDLRVGWLAKRANIPPSTLRYQLAKPSTLSYRNACTVASVLNIPLSTIEVAA